MTDFNGFGEGVIGKPLPADSTLGLQCWGKFKIYLK